MAPRALWEDRLSSPVKTNEGRGHPSGKTRPTALIGETMNSINHGSSQSGEPNNVPEWDENRVALALGRLAETLPSLVKDLVGVYNHLLDLHGDEDELVLCPECGEMVARYDTSFLSCWRCESGVTP